MAHDLDRSAACLSSGTMSTLAGYHTYDQLDRIQADFVAFCRDFPDYETWTDAWLAYQETGGTLLAWLHHHA